MKEPGSGAYRPLTMPQLPPPTVPPIELEVGSLMRAAKQGDSRSFDQLVRRLRGLSFQIAYSLVASREDALDLSQEAFLKVYKARASYRENDPFLPWFQRILRNTCISFLRKRGGKRAVSLDASPDPDEGGFDLPADLPPIETGLEQAELRDVVVAALARLSPNDREILSLRHFEELSYKEIAHLLELKEGTVMSRLFHARRRLRDQLAGHLEDHAVQLTSSAAPQ